MAPIDSSKKPIVWVLGGPGSGKGTQCEKIIAKYGFTHLSTGDLLRAEVKSGSERAKSLTAIMEQGGLVPNDVVLELLKEAIIARAADSKGFLVDGYPREKSQGIAFEQAIAPVSVILYFEASAETLTKRLLGRAASSGRADDNEETIKLRLKTFLDNNQQVLDQYPDKISRINAESSVDAIFEEVQKILDPIVAAANLQMERKKCPGGCDGSKLEKLQAGPCGPEIVKGSQKKPAIDSSKKPIVWVLGGPGSGKGTQCDKIIAKYGFTHLSTGDLLRAEVKSGSARAKTLTTIMEKGGLVPNDVVLELLKEAMIARAADSKGFLVDGYPREKSQGIAFEQSIAPVTVILYFEATAETLTKRLLGRAASSGRADDNEETIKLRLKTFLDNNQQVLDQYPQKLKRINAELSVDAIFAEVQKVLDPIVAAAK
nr:adenylate kinase isoenzyme 5 [Helicoverpa armigera]